MEENQNYNEETTQNIAKTNGKKGGMPIWLCIVAVILAISVSTVVTYYFASNAFNERYNASLSLLSKQRSLVSADLGDIYRAMDEIAIQYDDKYIYDVDYKKLADNILYDFAIETGDRYGAYYTAEDWAEETADSNGNSVGLGIYVTAHFEPGTQIVSDGLTVLLVMEDSPASEAGLMKGDLIKIIDGTAIKGMDYNEAVALSSGEIGTDAHITVERDGSDVEITVHRGKYSAQTVISNIIEANGAKIGYIKITEFYEITVDQFKNAVKSMLDAGCTGLVYDLRSNPGGYLDAVVNMLD
ncbi:MAG: PDZ domain-containing protein [Clostridiales bacterium]|nr:PDZ domain-containing protein [Clostridiales bacterium]